MKRSIKNILKNVFVAGSLLLSNSNLLAMEKKEVQFISKGPYLQALLGSDFSGRYAYWFAYCFATNQKEFLLKMLRLY